MWVLQVVEKETICFIFLVYKSKKVLTNEIIDKVVAEVEKKASEIEKNNDTCKNN